MLNPPVILTYHGIAEIRPAHDPVRLFVPPATLSWQVRRMQRRGFTFLKVSDFVARMVQGEDLRQTCALTFDDGSDDHLHVLPGVLSSLRVPGTVYVCRNLMGKPYPWLDEEAGVSFMSAEETVELSRDPLIEIGSHTNDHTILADASAEEAYREMAESKQTLEELLNIEITSFCYPGCRYSEACPDAAERAGYTNAVTCGGRGSWTPYALNRENIHTPDGRLTFELKSRGAYHGLVDLPFTRAARWATRPIRLRRERQDRGRD